MRCAWRRWLCGVMVLAPTVAHADAFAVFDVAVTFADGNMATGTVSFADQNALFATEDLTYRTGATVLATYTGEAEVIPFLPPPVPPFTGPTTTSLVSPGPAGNPYALNLIVPTGRLVDWRGGPVCLATSGCFEGLFTTATTTEASPYGGSEFVSEPAVSGSFTREATGSPAPEPAGLTLLATGLLAGIRAVRRRRPVQAAE